MVGKLAQKYRRKHGTRESCPLTSGGSRAQIMAVSTYFEVRNTHRWLRAAAMTLVATTLWSCDQPAADAPPALPAVVPTDSVVDSAPSEAVASTYDAAMGDLLLLPLVFDGGASGAVALLSPLQSPELLVSDTLGLHERVGGGRQIDLFARSGKVGERTVRVRAAASSDLSECPVWPTGEFLPDAGDLARDANGPRWLVGLPSGRARALPLDSIEALSSRDSALLAAALARAASALPEDSSSRFRGLPFTVRRAFRVADSTNGFVIGKLSRRIPQEDQPMEERLLLVLSTATANPREWTSQWHERASGREEDVIATEPLAVLSLGTDAPRLVVVLGRDDGTGTSVAMLERRGTRWRIRWESPITGC